MNGIIMCTAAALNIFSYPAGSTVVGHAPRGVAVSIMDGSLMRDWVFVGKPDPSGALPSPRGWVKYEYLGYCTQQAPAPQDPQEGSGS